MLLRRRVACAQGFAERAAGLVDLNERALTLRTGGLRSDDDDGGGRSYPDQYGQGGRCAPACFAACVREVARLARLGIWAQRSLRVSPAGRTLPDAHA